MRYLICYDIPDDKTRDNIVNYLERFAWRVQYSVFSCRLETERAALVWKDLLAIAAASEGKQTADKLNAMQSLDELRDGKWKWKERTQHPARNPVNALLKYREYGDKTSRDVINERVKKFSAYLNR